jgi:sortase A
VSEADVMPDDESGAVAAPPERQADPPGGPPPATTFGDRVRFVLRGVGQTLITLGVVVLLFVVYEVYVTNWFAHREQAKVHTALKQEWAAGVDPLLTLPQGQIASLDGKGIANLYIPRFGLDYAWTIVQGSTVPNDAELEKGPAHYGQTALPGQVGNFAVAGHRVGKGEPFLNLDRLVPGDAIIVETKSQWYVYRVKGATSPPDLSVRGADGVPGREVVNPTDGSVLLPVPDHPGVQATESLMTMTTCDPKFTAEHRMIVYAALDPTLTLPRTADTKPAAITALYDQAGG